MFFTNSDPVLKENWDAFNKIGLLQSEGMSWSYPKVGFKSLIVHRPLWSEKLWIVIRRSLAIDDAELDRIWLLLLLSDIPDLIVGN